MDMNKLVNIISDIVQEQMVQRNPDKYMTEAFKNDEAKIPVGVSNRHVHLADRDLIALFGDDAKLTNFKGLSQPGQFASEQLITLVGPNGVIEKVRVLGPTRKKPRLKYPFQIVLS
ncbi:hypothetical protein N752_18435 [Desulforamulus aquiferis]|nr:hypothetical protein N752_18435 [Desulforamulus aquiferis]